MVSDTETMREPLHKQTEEAGSVSTVSPAGTAQLLHCVRPFDVVPDTILRSILLCVPPDTRGRCAAVCRRWRDKLASHTMWEELDLRNVDRNRITPAFLDAVATRAAGHLQVVRYPLWCQERVDAPLRGFVFESAAADTLQELHVIRFCDLDSFELLIRLPLLRELNVADVLFCTVKHFMSVSRLLHLVTRLEISFYNASKQEALECAAALSACTLRAKIGGLKFLHLESDQDSEHLGHNDPAIVDALIEAAIAHRVSSLHLESIFHADNLSSLERLLDCGCLTSLKLDLVSPPDTPLEEHNSTVDRLDELIKLRPELTDWYACIRRRLSALEELSRAEEMNESARHDEEYDMYLSRVADQGW